MKLFQANFFANVLIVQFKMLFSKACNSNKVIIHVQKINNSIAKLK